MILLHIPFPIPLQREGYSFSVKCLQDLDKRLTPFPYVIFVGTKHAGEAFFTVKGRPGELPAVIVQESRSQAYASSCCYIRKITFIVFDLTCRASPDKWDQPVLNSALILCVSGQPFGEHFFLVTNPLYNDRDIGKYNDE